MYDGVCANCGRYSERCISRGPNYLACPKCVSVRREAVSGRVCSVCHEDRRTIIFHGRVVCGYCLPDKDLLCLFMTTEAEPNEDEPNFLVWWLIGFSLIVTVLFWLVVAYG